MCKTFGLQGLGNDVFHLQKTIDTMCFCRCRCTNSAEQGGKS